MSEAKIIRVQSWSDLHYYWGRLVHLCMSESHTTVATGEVRCTGQTHRSGVWRGVKEGWGEGKKGGSRAVRGHSWGQVAGSGRWAKTWWYARLQPASLGNAEQSLPGFKPSPEVVQNQLDPLGLLQPYMGKGKKLALCPMVEWQQPQACTGCSTAMSS